MSKIATVRLLALSFALILISCGGNNPGGDGGPPSPDFSFTATGPSGSVVSGAPAPIQFNSSALNGFNGSVQVAFSLPAGFQTDTPSPVSLTVGVAKSIKLTVPVVASTTRYSITFTGSSGTLRHDQTVTIQVTAPANLTVSFASPFLTARQAAIGTVTGTPGASIGCSFTDKNGVAISGFSVVGCSTLDSTGRATVTVTANGVQGDPYTLTVTSASTGQQATAQLRVIGNGNPSVTVDPSLSAATWIPAVVNQLLAQHHQSCGDASDSVTAVLKYDPADPGVLYYYGDPAVIHLDKVPGNDTLTVAGYTQALSHELGHLWLNRAYMRQTTNQATTTFVEGWAESCTALTLLSLAQANPTIPQALSLFEGQMAMSDLFFAWDPSLFALVNGRPVEYAQMEIVAEGVFLALATVISQGPSSWGQYSLKPFPDALYDVIARTGVWPTATQLKTALDLSATNSQGQVLTIDGLLPSQKFGQMPLFMALPPVQLGTYATCWGNPLVGQGQGPALITLCMSWENVQNNGPGTASYTALNLPLTVSVVDTSGSVVGSPSVVTNLFIGAYSVVPGAYKLLVQYQDQASGATKIYRMLFGVMPTDLPDPNTFPDYPLYAITANAAGDPVDGGLLVNTGVSSKLGPGFYAVTAPTGSEVVVNGQPFTKTALPRLVTVLGQ